jgi:hypothetical protein
MFWENFANFRKIFDITKVDKKPMIANPRNFPHKFEKRNTQTNDEKRERRNDSRRVARVKKTRVLRSNANGEETVVACGGNA